MKRQSFMFAGAGAFLAGCASPLTNPTLATAPDLSHANGIANDDAAQLLGSIMLAPYEKLPKDFERCHGQLVSISANTALYSLIFNKFGGNGQTNFGLPDLSKHAPIDGLTYFIAMRGIYPSRKALANWLYDPFMGTIACVPYEGVNLPPGGWSRCDGQVMPIERNVALYTLLGARFGGDGVRTFALPDLRKHQLGKGLTYIICVAGRYPVLQ